MPEGKIWNFFKYSRLYNYWWRWPWKYNKKYNFNIKLKEFDYKKLYLSYKNDSYISRIVINNIEISELSEEIILKYIYNGKKVLDIDYSLLYSNIKLLYISNIYNEELKKNLSLEDSLYIIFKISGKRIYNIKDIEKDSNNNYIITEKYINNWYQEYNALLGGNKILHEYIHILGRKRKVIKEGRIKYIKYNKELIKLTDAKKIEKTKKVLNK